MSDPSNHELVRTWPNSAGTGVYEIRKDDRGEVYCTCPAWKFFRGPADLRMCKHIRAWTEAVAAGSTLQKLEAP